MYQKIEVVVSCSTWDLAIVDLLEGDASMSLRDAGLRSAAIARHPYLVDSATMSTVRGPRLFWSSFPITASEGVLVEEGPAADLVTLVANPEPPELWLTPWLLVERG